MRINSLLSLSICLVIISGCTGQKYEEAAIQFSDSYKAPAFTEDNRIQKISEALSKSHHYYTETAEANYLPGVAYGMLVDDSLVFSGAYGSTAIEKGLPASEQSLFRIASMSKSFTAMAILKLRDEGKLSLSDPASKYIPQLEKLNYLTADASPLSIWNLLTMTAGFPEDNPWGDRFLDMSDEALMKQVETGISFSTVTSLNYEYSNLGFGLLGHIISIVSGMDYQEYIRANILLPLGMTHTYWEYDNVPAALLALGYRREDGNWVSEPLLHDGAFGAMGGLITSIKDFSKYVSFHLSAWPPRNDPPGDQPVKRSTLREMHRMNNPRFYTNPSRFGNVSAPIMRGYAYGLVAMKDQQGIVEVGHNGGLPGFGSSYMFYPEYGIGIMAFSNLTYVGGLLQTVNYRVIKELIKQGLFNPRKLPASDILTRRSMQVAELIQTWDPELEQDIIAKNLYLDNSRRKRMEEAKEMLDLVGKVLTVEDVVPENQLRGSFVIKGTKRNLQVYFTLTPEADPRVQWISMDLLPHS